MYPHDDFTVLIPALNEAQTVSDVVTTAFGSGASRVIVLDGGSVDATAELAERAGADVANVASLAPHGPSLGKGDAMWRGLSLVETPYTVYLDGDLRFISGDFVERLVAAAHVPGTRLAKAAFSRESEDSSSDPEGRVTMLVAQPLLAILYPQLADMREPLSGQIAAETDTLRSLSFDVDYGVDIGILLDIAMIFGVEAIAHPDCGRLGHISQADEDLRPMAFQVQRSILARASLVDVDESRVRQAHGLEHR